MGQAIAIRLCRRITVVTKQLRSCIEKHNLKHPSSQVTWESVTALDACDDRGLSTKHQSIRLFHKIARAEEEEHRILEDMKNTIVHYTELHSVLTRELSALKSIQSPSYYDKGVFSFLNLEIQRINCKLEQLSSFPQFSTYTSDIDLPLPSIHEELPEDIDDDDNAIAINEVEAESLDDSDGYDSSLTDDEGG